MRDFINRTVFQGVMDRGPFRNTNRSLLSSVRKPLCFILFFSLLFFRASFLHPITLLTFVSSSSSPMEPATAGRSRPGMEPATVGPSRPPRGNGGGDGRLSLRRCACCGTSVTPMWRTGPDGPKSLCNKCGLLVAKGRLERAPHGYVEGHFPVRQTPKATLGKADRPWTTGPEHQSRLAARRGRQAERDAGPSMRKGASKRAAGAWVEVEGQGLRWDSSGGIPRSEGPSGDAREVGPRRGVVPDIGGESRGGRFVGGYRGQGKYGVRMGAGGGEDVRAALGAMLDTVGDVARGLPPKPVVGSSAGDPLLRTTNVIPEMPVLSDEFRSLLLAKGFVRCPGEGCGLELSGESLPRHITRPNRCRSGGLAAMSPDRAAQTRMFMTISRAYRRAIVQGKAMPPDVQLASLAWRARETSGSAKAGLSGVRGTGTGSSVGSNAGGGAPLPTSEDAIEELATGPDETDEEVVCPAQGCGQKAFRMQLYYHLKHACSFGDTCSPERMQEAFVQSEAATRRALLPPRKQHSLKFAIADTEHLPAPDRMQARTRRQLQLEPAPRAPPVFYGVEHVETPETFTGSQGQYFLGAPSTPVGSTQHQQHQQIGSYRVLHADKSPGTSGQPSRSPSPHTGVRQRSSAGRQAEIANDAHDINNGATAMPNNASGSDVDEQPPYNPSPKAPHPMLSPLCPLPIMASLPQSLRRISSGSPPAPTVSKRSAPPQESESLPSNPAYFQKPSMPKDELRARQQSSHQHGIATPNATHRPYLSARDALSLGGLSNPPTTLHSLRPKDRFRQARGSSNAHPSDPQLEYLQALARAASANSAAKAAAYTARKRYMQGNKAHCPGRASMAGEVSSAHAPSVPHHLTHFYPNFNGMVSFRDEHGAAFDGRNGASGPLVGSRGRSRPCGSDSGGMPPSSGGENTRLAASGIGLSLVRDVRVSSSSPGGEGHMPRAPLSGFSAANGIRERNEDGLKSGTGYGQKNGRPSGGGGPRRDISISCTDNIFPGMAIFGPNSSALASSRTPQDESEKAVGKIGRPDYREIVRSGDVDSRLHFLPNGHIRCPAANCKRCLRLDRLVAHIESSDGSRCRADIIQHVGLLDACKAVDREAIKADTDAVGLSGDVEKNDVKDRPVPVRDDGEATEDEDEAFACDAPDAVPQEEFASIQPESSEDGALSGGLDSSSDDVLMSADEELDSPSSPAMKPEFSIMNQLSDGIETNDFGRQEDHIAKKRMRSPVGSLSPPLKRSKGADDAGAGGEGNEVDFDNGDDLLVDLDGRNGAGSRGKSAREAVKEKCDCPVPGCGAVIRWSKLPLHVHDPDDCKPREGLNEDDIDIIEEMVNKAYAMRWG